MSGVIPSNLKTDVSISNRFPEVHKRGIHTHTHTHIHTHTHTLTHTHTHIHTHTHTYTYTHTQRHTDTLYDSIRRNCNALHFA